MAADFDRPPELCVQSRDDAVDRGGAADQPVLRVEVDEAEARDGLARTGQGRRSQEADAVGRAGGVAARALPVGAVHDPGLDGGASGARHQERPARRLGVPARRGAELKNEIAPELTLALVSDGPFGMRTREGHRDGDRLPAPSDRIM